MLNAGCTDSNDWFKGLLSLHISHEFKRVHFAIFGVYSSSFEDRSLLRWDIV